MKSKDPHIAASNRRALFDIRGAGRYRAPEAANRHARRKSAHIAPALQCDRLAPVSVRFAATLASLAPPPLCRRLKAVSFAARTIAATVPWLRDSSAGLATASSETARFSLRSRRALPDRC